jgi:hypothetical protein
LLVCGGEAASVTANGFVLVDGFFEKDDRQLGLREGFEKVADDVEGDGSARAIAHFLTDRQSILVVAQHRLVLTQVVVHRTNVIEGDRSSLCLISVNQSVRIK